MPPTFCCHHCGHQAEFYYPCPACGAAFRESINFFHLPRPGGPSEDSSGRYISTACGCSPGAYSGLGTPESVDCIRCMSTKAFQELAPERYLAWRQGPEKK